MKTHFRQKKVHRYGLCKFSLRVTAADFGRVDHNPLHWLPVSLVFCRAVFVALLLTTPLPGTTDLSREQDRGRRTQARERMVFLHCQ
jgi:hypothetical protein